MTTPDTAKPPSADACARCDGSREVCVACGEAVHGAGDRKPCPDCAPGQPEEAVPGDRDWLHERAPVVSATLREAMLLTHYPHLQETGEGRVEGKCLEEPCVSMWEAARLLDAAVRAEPPREEGGAALEATVREIIAESPPEEWEPYDSWGDYVGYGEHGDAAYVEAVDQSNSGDVHAHGKAVRAQDIANRLRVALAAARAPGPVGGEALDHEGAGEVWCLNCRKAFSEHGGISLKGTPSGLRGPLFLCFEGASGQTFTPDYKATAAAPIEPGGA